MKIAVNLNIASFYRSRKHIPGMADELVNIRAAGEIGRSQGFDSESFCKSNLQDSIFVDEKREVTVYIR
jgi:hypothetical protein